MTIRFGVILNKYQKKNICIFHEIRKMYIKDISDTFPQ